MRNATLLVFAFFASAIVVASAPACSGSSATVGGGDGDSGPSSDASPATDAPSGADGSLPTDGGGDAGKDSGIVVVEKPPPACHDLTQHASIVTALASPDQPPAQVPITTIAPGLYVLASETDYGGITPVDPGSTSRTTVFFTSTRQYYLSESGSGAAPQVLTLDWKIANNRLTRKVLCAQNAAQIGTTVDYRIDAAPNGSFIIYVPFGGPGSLRTQAFRYDPMN